MGISACEASVTARFSAAAETYDSAATVLSTVADDLMGMVSLASPECILDLGCGTGILTRRLSERFPQARVLGLDISRDMLQTAARNLAGRTAVNWECADFHDDIGHKAFDLIASSAAIHWATSLPHVFTRLHAAVRPNGQICLAVMLKNTLGELHAVRQQVAPGKAPLRRLPERDDMLRAASVSGLVCLDSLERTYVSEHPSAEALLQCLHAQGVTGGGVSHGRQLLTRSELMKLTAAYDSAYRTSSGVRATYHVGFLSLAASS